MLRLTCEQEIPILSPQGKHWINYLHLARRILTTNLADQFYSRLWHDLIDISFSFKLSGIVYINFNMTKPPNLTNMVPMIGMEVRGSLDCLWWTAWGIGCLLRTDIGHLTISVISQHNHVTIRYLLDMITPLETIFHEKWYLSLQISFYLSFYFNINTHQAPAYCGLWHSRWWKSFLKMTNWCLTHWGLGMSYGMIEFPHHWFR